MSSHPQHQDVANEPVDSDASATGPVDSHQTEPSTSKNGWLKRGLKFAGRSGIRLMAWDVVYKDAKRVKPRYPYMWRAVFSRAGLSRIRHRMAHEQGQSIGFTRAVLMAGLTALMAWFLFFFTVAFAYHVELASMPLINRLSTSIALVVMLVLAISYSAITVMQVYYRIQQQGTVNDER